MKNTLLIIDDDRALNELLSAYFEHDYNIVQAFDGEEGLTKFTSAVPDIILLDVMMPKLDGIEVLKEIRQQSNVFIIMLTAKAEDIDRILGLELGADDYLAKPCHPRELGARIKNLLHRLTTNVTVDYKDSQCSPIIRDDKRRQFRVDSHFLNLTDIEFEVLSRLYDEMLHVVTKDVLFVSVFNRELLPFDRTLDVHVSNIRKKISDSSVEIQTIRGKGYRLCPAEGK